MDRNFLKTVRDQLAVIDRDMSYLQRQRAALNALLEHETPRKPAPARSNVSNVAAKPAAQPTKAVRATKKNYIGIAIPEMIRCGGEMSLSALRTYIAAQPGLAGVTSNNLNAAIQHEMRKGDASRIARVASGVYGLTRAATAGGAPLATLPDDMPDAPEPELANAPGY